MIEYKKISLEYKALFDSYLSKDFFYLSDVSFANLYIWHKAREISFAIINNCLVIRTCYAGEKPFYFFPIGENESDKIACVQEMMSDCEKKGEVLEFHSLEQKSVEMLNKHFESRFSVISNRDRSDYVYNIKELIELSGRKYHKKKNHLNQFLQTYPDFKYQSIDSSNKHQVLEVWKKWFGAQSEVSDGLKNENVGIIDALSQYELLGLKGGFVSVDDTIIAFSFGEAINAEMAVIHIEKADFNYHGAYQIINQQLLLNEFSSYLYANREEDLGIEGLRRAKMSYNPVFLVEKFEARLKA